MIRRAIAKGQIKTVKIAETEIIPNSEARRLGFIGGRRNR